MSQPLSRLRGWGLLGLGLVLALTPLPAAQADQYRPSLTDETAAGLYVVTLAAAPSAVEAATRQRPGRRFDRTSAKVTRSRERLLGRQDDLLRQVGDPEVLYRFTTATNGFAAVLDPGQVSRLRSMPQVVLVERSITRTTDSDATGLLGLPGAGGVWAGQGGGERAGRGIVIGLVDTGIWPENPSFAGLPQRVPGRSRDLPGFHGACAEGEQWERDDCNDKIVSARWFAEGFGAEARPGAIASQEYLSARDSTGHGSHAASTAAGARGVRVTMAGQAFGRSAGMAPGARLAIYKACWTAPDPDDDGCTTADLVAAVDQAVADGVDVLGFSAAGQDDPTDSLGRAFLGATSAGVVVSASAGTRGPGPGTVGSTSPWVTTVAASTHRTRQGAVVLGDGRSLVGAMSAQTSVPPTPAVLAADAPAPGASGVRARACASGSLDTARVRDRIVVCERGLVARVEKSAAVAQADGRAMVLVNSRPDTVDADVHSVPTVHLDRADGVTLLRYLRESAGSAALSLDAHAAHRVPVPAVASYSGRGPSAETDLLKPDLAAPGVGVLGATSPTADAGRLWDLLSGTSVSSAHVAGLAALLRASHPVWSASRVKSAMMTTATRLADDAGPWAVGAGQVDPRAFTDPGLSFDVRPEQWRDYAAGRLPARDLNLPSVAVGRLVGSTSVLRRLTNVSGRRETYVASSRGLDGVRVRVRPERFTLRSGQSRRVRIRLVAEAASPSSSTGRLVWSGSRHQVTVPVAVTSVPVAAPAEITGTGERGRTRVTARTGSGAPPRVRSTGLVAAEETDVVLGTGGVDAGPSSPGGAGPGADLDVPAGTVALRIQVDAPSGDDADLYLYRGDALVDSATGPGSTARITVPSPTPGRYTVQARASGSPDGSSRAGRLSTWVVPAVGDLPVEVAAPRSGPPTGRRFSFSVAWSAATRDRSWLGVLTYGDTDERTLLTVG